MAKKSHELDIEYKELRVIGKRIRQLRQEKGYNSHETFAYDNGLSRSQYWRYENGKDLKISTLLRILKYFDISIEEFFNEKYIELRENK